MIKRVCAASDCKVEFFPSQNKDAHRYCSDRCRYREIARKKRQKHFDEGKCPACGGEWIEPDELKKYKPQYCKSCQQYFSNRYEKSKNEEYSNT